MNFSKGKPIDKSIYLILGFLIFFNIPLWVWVKDLNEPRFLEVIFFDVGQGDSIFIETPSGQQVLIDGGPSSKILLEKLTELMPFYDRTIDLIILTHPEYDHYRGLFGVLERYKVENILWNGVVRDNDEWREWARLIKEEGANIRIAQAGQRVVLEKQDKQGACQKIGDRRFFGKRSVPCAYIDILYPFDNLEGQEFENSNDTSVVAQLVFNDIEILLTGDISKKVELKLVGNYNNLKSEILKAAHHGSKTSSALKFLEAVSPEVAVIQCGKDNRYGHPHSGVLANLEQFGIQVLRTDRQGDIKIVSDGNNFKIWKVRSEI